jgi:hypothetical protein
MAQATAAKAPRTPRMDVDLGTAGGGGKAVKTVRK